MCTVEGGCSGWWLQHLFTDRQHSLLAVAILKKIIQTYATYGNFAKMHSCGSALLGQLGELWKISEDIAGWDGVGEGVERAMSAWLRTPVLALGLPRGLDVTSSGLSCGLRLLPPLFMVYTMNWIMLHRHSPHVGIYTSCRPPATQWIICENRTELFNLDEKSVKLEEGELEAKQFNPWFTGWL